MTRPPAPATPRPYSIHAIAAGESPYAAAVRWAERSEALEARLALAEAVCVMYGWSALATATSRQRATSELWKRWAAAARADGIGIGPKDQPEVAAFEATFLASAPAAAEAVAADVLADVPPLRRRR